MMDEHPSIEPRQRVRTAANDEQPRIPDAVVKHDARAEEDKRPRFDIYLSDRVSLTSTLFGGGDWHWRLVDAGGAVLADCGGYKAEEACRLAVYALRDVAGQASIPGPFHDNS